MRILHVSDLPIKLYIGMDVKNKGTITAIHNDRIVFNDDYSKDVSSIDWSFVYVPATEFIDNPNNYTECVVCGGVYKKDDMIETVDGIVCDDCIDQYQKCYHCKDYFRDDNINYACGNYVCDDCLDDSYRYCNSCNEFFIKDEVDYVDGNYYCNDCFDRYYIRCERCGEPVGIDYSYYDEDTESSYCERCYDHINTSNLIHNHWAKLSVKFHNTDGITSTAKKDKLYFGMELEFECKNNSKKDIAELIHDSSRDNYYLEEDGSLSNGIEIVFHARVWESWQKYLPKLNRDVLSRLRSRGCSAHDAGTCGIHIHTNLDAWGDDQLYRLFCLLHNPKNYNYVLNISQRKKAKLDQWASLKIGDINKQKWRIKNKRKSSERYSALNITDDTLEIRIFNSNLRLDRVYKNLEFVYALYHYTAGCQRATWAGFMRWINKNASEVPNLYEFMVDTGMIVVSELALAA